MPYAQDIAERHRDPQRADAEAGAGAAAGAAAMAVQFVGRTPWQADAVPDMADMDDFPTMGAGHPATATSAKWGPHRAY